MVPINKKAASGLRKVFESYMHAIVKWTAH